CCGSRTRRRSTADRLRAPPGRAPAPRRWATGPPRPCRRRASAPPRPCGRRSPPPAARATRRPGAQPRHRGPAAGPAPPAARGDPRGRPGRVGERSAPVRGPPRRRAPSPPPPQGAGPCAARGGRRRAPPGSRTAPGPRRRPRSPPPAQCRREHARAAPADPCGRGRRCRAGAACTPRARPARSARSPRAGAAPRRPRHRAGCGGSGRAAAGQRNGAREDSRIAGPGGGADRSRPLSWWHRPGCAPGVTDTHSSRRRAAMSALEDQTILRETATRVLDAHGLVLEEVEIRRGGGTPQVRLVVDLPEDQLGSADLDAVADASRALSEAVDADDAVLGSTPVLLEVTTPGVDRELTAPRHFRRSRGRLLALTV